MATKRNRVASRRGPVGDPAISRASDLFSGNSGRWATSRFKAAMAAGKALTTGVLRTADTLRHEDWKVFDSAIIEEGKIRLVGVADLLAAGFVTPVANALGKTVFGYERVTDMDEAIVSLDGLGQSSNDRLEFDLNQLPLPVIHKDFFLNLRNLSASRSSGEPLDTMHARAAGRVVAEKMEYMLFQGETKKFGGLSIYGYMTHPNRNLQSFDGSKHWGDSTKTGASYLLDLQAAIAKLHEDRMYGPYWVYVPTDAGIRLDSDYSTGTANTITIRERLLKLSNVQSIKVADQLPSGNVIVVQATPDVTNWVQGVTPQAIQWDEAGGFKLQFKAFAIGVPLIRADIAGRSGVCHLS